MTIPHRGTTTESTYFVTANVLERKTLFHVEKIASLFVEVMLDYRTKKKYLLHEFVVMTDHFHLLLTPRETLERAVQLIKGGFSFRAKKELGFAYEIWQPSYYDRRVRDMEEYFSFREYIRCNPVKRGLGQSPEEYAYSSVVPGLDLDKAPQRLKPVEYMSA